MGDVSKDDVIVELEERDVSENTAALFRDAGVSNANDQSTFTITTASHQDLNNKTEQVITPQRISRKRRYQWKGFLKRAAKPTIFWGLVHFFLAWGSIYLSLPSFYTFWPANGSYVAALLVTADPHVRRIALPLVFVLSGWAANLIHAQNMSGFVYPIFNAFECITITWIIRRAAFGFGKSPVIPIGNLSIPISSNGLPNGGTLGSNYTKVDSETTMVISDKSNHHGFSETNQQGLGTNPRTSPTSKELEKILRETHGRADLRDIAASLRTQTDESTYKPPPREILRLDERKHLIAFGVGTLIGVIIVATIVGIYSLLRYKIRFSEAFIQWFSSDILGYIVTATPILTTRAAWADATTGPNTPSLPVPWYKTLRTLIIRFIRSRPITVVLLGINFCLIPLVVILSNLYLPNFPVLGVYLVNLLTSLAAILLSLLGASWFALWASVIVVWLSKYRSISQQYDNLSDTNRFIFTQFLLILMGTSALMVGLIQAEKDKALREVEHRVEERTSQLLSALEVVGIARTEAERAARDKENFMGFLCHELRNPLHAVTNLSQDLVASPPRSPTTPTSLESSSSKQQSSREDPMMLISSIKFLADYMLALVNDVLDTSRLSSGRVSLESVRVDLCHLLQQHSIWTRENANSQGVEFQLTILQDPPLPRIIRSDPIRLQQVLNNLLSNATKFTNKGGKVECCIRRLTKEEERDHLLLIQAENTASSAAGNGVINPMPKENPEAESVTLEFKISDTGIGIPSSMFPDLFKPFSQARPSTTREYGGSGLGLTITNQIIKLMGGSIRIDSEEGKGSVFTVCIPMEVVEWGEWDLSLPTGDSRKNTMTKRSNSVVLKSKPPLGFDNMTYKAAAISAALTAPPSSLPLRSPRPSLSIPSTHLPSLADPCKSSSDKVILIIDDSSINRAILRRILSRLLPDALVLEASDGAAGLEIACANRSKLKIVFMDIVMPVMGGYEASNKMRKEGLTVPIIATTANDVKGENAKTRIEECGINSALGKPFNIDDVKSILERFGVLDGDSQGDI